MRDFQSPGRSPVLATSGMCATSHPLAAKVAVDILERGGNAVDAAIAGAVLLGICEPQMTGIGGDCFVLISPGGNDDIIAMNGSGRAPAALTSDKLRAEGHSKMPLHAAHSVTIPTAIDAFCRLSQDFGKLGLDAVLAPAIHYAETGVPVAPRVAKDWIKSEPTLKGHGRQHYLINGAIPKVGDIFAAPGQAEVLRRIAHHGRDGFYSGEVARDMVGSLQAAGGLHTIEDFASARADYTTPIKGDFHAHDLIEHPPNGQGATAILLLNILKHFDLAALDPNSAKRAHIEAEAAKLAYDARNRFIADPDVLDATERMTDLKTAEQLAGLIRMDTVLHDVPSITEAVHKDTVYITVVDKNRMSVSLIYSIFHGFGAGLASEKFGILFQNRGAGFSLEPNHPNELGPGKRPLHTIIPGMLCRDGRAIMPFGVMGGQYQPTGHARIISNMLAYGMDPQTAIDAPRCFADQGKLIVETGYSGQVAQELADLGHDVTRPDAPLGGGQAIYIHENGVLVAGSDPRKDGCAIGY